MGWNEMKKGKQTKKNSLSALKQSSLVKKRNWNEDSLVWYLSVQPREMKVPYTPPSLPLSDLSDWISSPVERLTQYFGFKSQLCKWRKKKRMAERQRKMWDTQMQHLISVIIQETPPSQPTEDRRRCKRRRETKRRKQKIQPLFAVNYFNMIFRWCRCRCWMLMMTLLIINEWSLLLFH